MKYFFTIFTLFLTFKTAFSQENHFEKSYELLKKMSENPNEFNFKKAVFSVENAYLEGNLDTLKVEQQLKFLTSLCNQLIQNRELDYPFRDKIKMSKYAAIFSVMKEKIPIIFGEEKFEYKPFEYDFKDVFGHEELSSLFVSKLLETRKGNCRSLPYLYKILAEEMGVNASLALAPNHVYIKLKNEKEGWYNTELTSGIFPYDAWIVSSGYIHLTAIQNGVYMKALNNEETLAVLLVDLAEAYDKKFPQNDGKFILQCTKKAIEKYPNFAKALILKAETNKKIYEEKVVNLDEENKKIEFKKLENEYKNIHEIGYRNMPESMYLYWLSEMKKENLKQEYLKQGKEWKEEPLSKEEIERRKKNIEIGNPFKKYGYTPKIATLSKGKYLEFHDRDSIVIIGTVKFQAKKKYIKEFFKPDLTVADAQPTLDTSGKWLSPDPLMEEFPDKSPYNFVNNNPVRFVDKLGLSPDDVIYAGGLFVGTDEKGFNGEIRTLTSEQYSNLSNTQKDQINAGTLKHSEAQKFQTLGQKIDNLKEQPGGTRVDAEVKEINQIINHVVSKTQDIQGMEPSKLHNGSVSSVFDNGTTFDKDRVYGVANGGKTSDALANSSSNKITFNLQSWTGRNEIGSSLQPTVANLQNTYVHEAGHQFRGIIGGQTRGHGQATQLQINHPTWISTTPAFKIYINGLNNTYKSYSR
jgi:hypothetical protein